MGTLIERIVSHEARVVVVGIGYVGLPLCVEFARAGFRVTGYDPNQEKVDLINAGRSYLEDVPKRDLAPLVEAERLQATTDESILDSADAVIVCVPTPLNKSKDPDVSFILASTETICRHLHRDMVIVLESTTYPGTTRELVAPRFEEAGMTIGEDLFLAFSPERVDPGNRKWGIRNTPKVIGGMTDKCLKAARLLYQQAIERLVPVSSTDAAEMTKLLENTFRAINIGLVNELALMCEKLGVESWEVIDAAATKPFGFMPFYPGPGLGGHCIPIDPLYLSWKLRTLKYTARFVELADDINRGMPAVVVRKIGDALNSAKKSVNGSRVLVMGVAYKQDIADVRESPALDVIAYLEERGAVVDYEDPHVARIDEHNMSHEAVVDPRYSDYDCVAILTDHSAFDLTRVVKESKIVLDTRNATRGLGDLDGARIFKL